VVLTDHSADGTYVDGVRVSGQHDLQLGQVVRIGTLGQELQLIASVEADET
jgi:pSer/pThr/pTyr-binding forkhead associated (FHA) protein